MKYLTVIIFCAFLTACGQDGDRIAAFPNSVGATGNSGAVGATGATGSQGSAGVQGNPGSNGNNGSNGSNGAPGTSGAAGAAGLGSIPGISCAVYNLPTYSNSTTLPEAFIGNAIVGTFILSAFNIPNSLAVNGFPGMPAAIQTVVGFDGYALDCDGYINITTSGDDYVFQLLSDDGSELRINDVIVISNQGVHAPSSVTSAATHLDRGLNKINIVYFQGPLTQIALQLSMSGPNLANEVVPALAYTH